MAYFTRAYKSIKIKNISISEHFLKIGKYC